MKVGLLMIVSWKLLMSLIILVYFYILMVNSIIHKTIAGQGHKALFSLINVCKQNSFNIETLLSVFDTYVASVINYGTEIWGFHTALDIHLNFCKRILNLRRSINTSIVCFELGRYPLQFTRNFKIF